MNLKNGAKWLGVVVIIFGILGFGGRVFAASGPVITSIRAVDGNASYKDGDTVHIAVQFSQAVDVTNSPFLQLNTGGAANYISGSGTDTLTFDYYVWFEPNNPALNVNYISLNGNGTIMDSATGLVNASLTLPSGLNLADNNTVVIDNAAPTVTSADITGPHQVTVNFSENVNNNSSGEYTNFGGALAGHTITGQNGNNGTSQIVLTFDGAPLVNNGDGTMDIGTDITDQAGNHFAGSSGQKVSADKGPLLTSVVYNDVDKSGTVSGTDTVTFSFNRKMNTAAIDPASLDSALGISNGHTFGTVANGVSSSWTDNHTLVVILGSDTTITNNDTVFPSNSITNQIGTWCTNSDPIAILTNGWYAQFWNFGSGSSPDITTLPATPDFMENIDGPNGTDFETDWASGSPDSSINQANFVGKFSKTAYFDAGTYNLHIDSDDGIIVKVDGGKLILAWQDGFTDDIPVDLSAGYHTILLIYYQNGGTAHLQADFQVMSTLQTAVVNGATLTLGYDYSVKDTSVPDTTDYQVTVNGNPVAVSNVSITGNKKSVTLTLATAVKAHDVVLVNYTPGVNPIQNGSSKRSSVALVSQAVENDTASQMQGSGGSTTGSGGMITYTCKDPKASNYNPYGASNPSLCNYGTNVNQKPDASNYSVTVHLPQSGFTKTLRLGMTDAQVALLQSYLGKHGFMVTPAGKETKYFGTKTKKELALFQKSVGINATGNFGLVTMKYVNSH